MASIPNNGYAAVMAGTNVYTGSNFYGSDCPKTPIVPVDPDDLCNKLYVDTIAGGGTVVSVTGGNNILITGTTPAPIVNLRSPLTSALDVGTQDITSTTSTIDITPLAGQDCNVNVSGAGGLHAVQTSAGGTAQPIARFNNNNASAGAVTIRTNKTGRNAASNDVISSLQFNSRNFNAVDTTFAKIECVATTATAGDTDGSIDFYTNINTPNNNQLVFRLNGADNENNSFRPFDLNGNDLKTSTGAMTITTAASTGAGTLNLISKAGATAAMTGGGALQFFANAGAVSTVASAGIVSTATTGGISFTAGAGGLIQNNTTGAFTVVATSGMSLTSNLGIFGITQELHYGKLTTPYTEQEFRSVYQPILTNSTNTFPFAEIQREGQQVILINSGGDGANELTPIASPAFAISSMIYKADIASYIAGGINLVTNTCEVRCASSVAGLQSPISFVKFLANPSYFVNVVYQSPLFPNLVAVGGSFEASVFGSYDGSNPWPSPVANFVVIDATTSVIFPISMLDPSSPPNLGFYGVNQQVRTITAQSNTYYTPADAPIFILGGDFTDIISNISPNQPAFRTAVFCPQGTITLLNVKWLSFIDADAQVNFLWCLDDRVVFAGLFNVIGGSSCPFLAYNDVSLVFPSTALIAGFTPPATVNSGYQLSGVTCYFGCNQDPVTFEYPVYTFNLSDMLTTPTVILAQPPAVATGFLSDNGSVLDFIVGHNGGTSNYCYKVGVPDYLDLNGLTLPQNCAYDFGSAAPTFFREPDEIVNAPYDFWQYIPTSGTVSITTNESLPFVTSNFPTQNFKTITLATRNNFATGTVVQFGTDDQRIVILASSGASFSN
jgi:hypothetical protein